MSNGLNKRRENQYHYIIVAGCSRAGAKIASTLSARRKDVVVIDKDGLAFRELARDYSGFTIEADATDIDTLKNAKIDKADVVVAATDNDNVNIMIAQIASRIFGVPKVVTRLFESEKQVLYKDDPIQIIHPTELTLHEFETLVSKGVAEVTRR